MSVEIATINSYKTDSQLLLGPTVFSQERKAAARTTHYSCNQAILFGLSRSHLGFVILVPTKAEEVIVIVSKIVTDNDFL